MDNTSKRIKITDTTLRDAHQSLIATRLRTEEMLPIVDKIDAIGFHSVEMWGGATFDACLRFLKEDPWQRLRQLKDGFKQTKLQMLLRGQNILGYRHYSDDVVEYFVQKAVANGIDIIRVFDALNDTRNLETAVKAAKKEGAHVQLAIAYSISDYFTLDYYKNLVKRLVDLGADSICVKDMSGLLLPYDTTELVKAIKQITDLPLQLHSHNTSGEASMSYLKGIEAGCDVIDTSISTLAMGTAQPATEVMVEALKNTEYDTGLDLTVLSDIAEYFRPIRNRALESGLLNPKVLEVNTKTLLYQVPGGMLSNLVSQLKDQKMEHKFYEVLEEVPRVRKDFGYPPLVTPSSQIVGTQAVFNVLTGQRYKIVPKESKALVRGEYGQTPIPISHQIRKQILGTSEIIDCRPADLLQPSLEQYRQEASRWAQSDEDVLSYALFPQVAIDFFEYRHGKQTKVDLTMASKQDKTYPV